MEVVKNSYSFHPHDEEFKVSCAAILVKYSIWQSLWVYTFENEEHYIKKNLVYYFRTEELTSSELTKVTSSQYLLLFAQNPLVIVLLIFVIVLGYLMGPPS